MEGLFYIVESIFLMGMESAFFYWFIMIPYGICNGIAKRTQKILMNIGIMRIDILWRWME